MRSLATVLLFTMPVLAQLIATPVLPTPTGGRLLPFSPALQQYFEFSADQVLTIQRLNAALQQFQTEKFARSSRVQMEIAQEIVKPTLDAMALGLRHVELEAIQREIRAQHFKTYEEIQKLLTPAQKTKLEALTAAMRLQGMICEAQSQNLLSVVMPSIRIGGAGSTGGDAQPAFASFLLGAPAQAMLAPGCTFPASFIRGGLTTMPGLVP